jgi:thioredoxin 1
MTGPIVTLTDATFDEDVGGSPRPVLVDFWAPWCAPCKLLDPVLEDVARQHGDRIRVARLDVDDNPDTARRFMAMSVPTLVVFRDGEPVKRLVGARGKARLLQELVEFLV